MSAPSSFSSYSSTHCRPERISRSWAVVMAARSSSAQAAIGAGTEVGRETPLVHEDAQQSMGERLGHRPGDQKLARRRLGMVALGHDPAALHDDQRQRLTEAGAAGRLVGFGEGPVDLGPEADLVGSDGRTGRPLVSGILDAGGLRGQRHQVGGHRGGKGNGRHRPRVEAGRSASRMDRSEGCHRVSLRCAR